MLAGLTIADDPAAWRAAGFAPGTFGLHVGSIVIDLVGASEPRGVRAWTLRAAPHVTDVDGLATITTDEDPPPPAAVQPNTTTVIDHIVVGSPNRERTKAVLADVLGLEPRREADHVLYDRPMVQTFYHLGECILEVISRPEAEGDGPCVFWGLAFTVADLDATAEMLGDVLGPAKEAVQPGRRIATLRGRDIGISVPVAFLTPRP